MKNFKNSLIRAWLSFLLVSVGICNMEASRLSLPKENLAARLERLANEYHVNISFDKKSIINITVPELNNKGMKLENTLDQSLKSTGFTWVKLMDGSVVVKLDTGSKSKVFSGKIQGTVTDKQGSPIVGATVVETSTQRGTVTDANGQFSLSFPPGEYIIRVSFVSFQTQEVATVVKGNTITPLKIALKEENISIQGVDVEGKIRKTSEAGLQTMQKQSAEMMNGISAAQIAKTPDSDVGATMKRITGVTTLDNKYVVVRSLGDRWNQASMDGANLPSTDPFEQHFSFDIIPTAIVDAIVVKKTATPDVNSGFSGGSVEVITKDIPETNFMNLSVGTSYNSQSTFKNAVTKQRGKWDYFGFDDGTRSYPTLVKTHDRPTSEEEADTYISNSKMFTQDNFTNYVVKAPLNTSYKFTIGHTFNLGNNNKWGIVGAATFSNKQETEEIEHTERGAWLDNSIWMKGDAYDYLYWYTFKNSGGTYTYKSSLAGMLNTGMQIGKTHITLRNTYTHLYNNQLTQTSGWDDYETNISTVVAGTTNPSTIVQTYPVFQSFIQNKLDVEHRFNNLEINWFVARSYTRKDIKDATHMAYGEVSVGDEGETRIGYSINNSDGASMYRENSWNKETDYNWGATVKKTFHIGNTKNEVKAGYYGTHKRAENKNEKATIYYMVEKPSGKHTVEYMPYSELLNGSYYKWGYYAWESYNYYGNKFVGEVQTQAPFAMLDQKFTNWLRLVWGVRYESYDYTQLESQVDTTAYDSEDFIDTNDDKWQFMPSFNLTIYPVKNLNLRLAYFESMIRPQFAERIQVPVYDPVRNATIMANRTSPLSSKTQNYDFRIEWFPSPGNMISSGIYYKYIDKPLEQVGDLTSSGDLQIFPVNAHHAKLTGLEFEFNRNFSFLGKEEVLSNIHLVANATFNWTTVIAYNALNPNYDGNDNTYESNRPLAGQTPYAYNVGIDYTGQRFGFAISHNTSGDQYLTVGYDLYAEEIRTPYCTTDAQVSYKFFKNKNLEFKAYARNIFNSEYKTYNNVNSYKGDELEYEDRSPRIRFERTPGTSDKYDEGIDMVKYLSHKGVDIGASLKYSF